MRRSYIHEKDQDGEVWEHSLFGCCDKASPACFVSTACFMPCVLTDAFKRADMVESPGMTCLSSTFPPLWPTASLFSVANATKHQYSIGESDLTTFCKACSPLNPCFQFQILYEVMGVDLRIQQASAPPRAFFI